MDKGAGVTGGLAMALEVAGIFVVAWGMLLVLTLGLTVTGIGSSVVFAAYGVAVIQADRRAVPLGWMVTILMAIATLVDGLPPVLVLVWSGFFVLSMFLSDSRHRLCRGGRRLGAEPHVPNSQPGSLADRRSSSSWWGAVSRTQS